MAKFERVDVSFFKYCGRQEAIGVQRKFRYAFSIGQHCPLFLRTVDPLEKKIVAGVFDFWNDRLVVNGIYFDGIDKLSTAALFVASLSKSPERTRARSSLS